MSDYMSSEHSDPGNVPIEQFKVHRQKFIGNNKGWEVRRLEWRSRKASTSTVSTAGIKLITEHS
jgi:hypothetical protein